MTEPLYTVCVCVCEILCIFLFVYNSINASRSDLTDRFTRIANSNDKTI